MKIKYFILFFLLGLEPVLAQGLPDFTELVKDNSPAIVNVSTVRAFSDEDMASRENLEELLRYFYGDRYDDMPPDMEQRPDSSAFGSGFIISPDGYLVTNHHVVDGADEIRITLNDRREYVAELIGSDESSDLALLKIDAADLPSVTFNTTDDLQVGEWVLAIGSPFGLSYSVSAGIVSYIGRSLPSMNGQQYVSFIQTDVPINPGHSGGPLFNLEGEVVGINSQIFSNSGGSIGLSFAIPVDVAINVIGQLQDRGYVVRGWMGVAIEDVSADLAEAFNLDTPHGALVSQVIPSSPADYAGFRSGDIIVSFAGHPIQYSADLPYHVGLIAPGTESEVEVIRDGDVITIVMEVGTLNSAALASQVPPAPQENRIGLVVEEIPDDMLETMDLNSGLAVAEVQSGIARDAGFRSGDIILSMNGQEVGSVEAFEEQLEALPSDRAIPVLISRAGRQTFLTLRIPAP